MEHTHKSLVDIAYSWVLDNGGCGVAFKEFNSSATNGEYPDVIGFGNWGHSVVVEVKVSRADFLKDKKKSFRANPDEGMGSHRFYCCPTGLIKKEEIPDGWGLLYVNDEGRCRKVVSQNYKIDRFAKGVPKNLLAEHSLMYTALRRLAYKGLLSVIYDKDYHNENDYSHLLTMNKEQAAKLHHIEISEHYDNLPEHELITNAFIAGATWQEQQSHSTYMEFAIFCRDLHQITTTLDSLTTPDLFQYWIDNVKNKG